MVRQTCVGGAAKDSTGAEREHVKKQRKELEAIGRREEGGGGVVEELGWPAAARHHSMEMAELAEVLLSAAERVVHGGTVDSSGLAQGPAVAVRLRRRQPQPAVR